MTSKPIIFQIVGYSGSHKTTLLKNIIAKLTDHHLKVSSIKSARGHKKELSTKDSDILFSEGASPSVVIFQNLTQFFLRNTSLTDIIKNITHVEVPDIIFIEGFKKGPYKKIIIWTEDLDINLTDFDLSNIFCLYCPPERYFNYKDNVDLFREKYSLPIITDIEPIIRKLLEEVRVKKK